MSRSLLLTPLFLALLLWGACSDDTAPGADQGLPDGAADARPDQQALADLGADQGSGAADSARPDTLASADSARPDSARPDTLASADQGADMSVNPRCRKALNLNPFTLAKEYCAVYRFTQSGSPAAFNFHNNDVYVLSLSSVGSNHAGEVNTFTIDTETGLPGAASSVFSFSFVSAATIYAGSYLALSPKPYAAVGYTESGTFDGAIYWGDKGITTPKKVDKATGNFDAVYLDDQTLLVNGTGLGATQSGQGVYGYQEGKTPVLLIKDLGIASGFMGLGMSTLYVGGYFASGGSKIYGLTLGEVKAAITGGKTLSATTNGDLIYAGSTLDAAALGDDLVVATLDTSWAFKSVDRVTVTIGGPGVGGSTVTPLWTKTVLSKGSGASALDTVGALAAGTSTLGLLLSDGSTTELAFVEPR